VDASLDTARVLWLLAALGLVVVPHALRVPVWVSIAVAGVLGLRALFAWRGMGLPPGWWLGVLAAGAAAGIWQSYGMLYGRDSAVGLLLLMLCLKALELRARRDAHVLVLLGYFLLVTGFLYSQSIATALYLLGCVWVLTACLMAFQREPGRASIPALLRGAAVMLAQAAPLMLVLFLLFPRVQGPLWGLPLAQNSALTGLSDSMSPGSLSSLSLSDAVAFRVDFFTPPPPPSRLYWRGPVMWDFDGRTWRAGEAAPIAGTVLRDLSEPISYAVTLEPHNMRWLFAVDIPARRLEGSLLTADFQLLTMRPVRARMRYELASWLVYRAGQEELPRNLQRALTLPAGYNPRSRELALRLREQSSDPRELVSRSLALFRDQPFFYTLAPPELGRDSVDEFLFDVRRGFCEHFASSFVFLMRAAGVPARIVTGYQGGVMNPVGNYLIVRQSEAHAWAEVWLQGEGWVRIDPTAAVSPQRIEAGIAAAVPAGEPLPLMVRTDNALLKRARFTLDAMANGWNQWVLGYTPERQREIFQRLGMPRATWQNLAAALAAATGAVVLALTLITLHRLRAAAPDAVMRAWNALSSRLAPLGLARRPHEGPIDHGERVAAALPESAREVHAIAALVAQLRYGRVAAPGALDELRRRVRAFRPAPRRG
jgi:transglutaminase-like putative cysteine protease